MVESQEGLQIKMEKLRLYMDINRHIKRSRLHGMDVYVGEQ